MGHRTDAVDVNWRGERRLVLQPRDARSDPTGRGLLFDLRTAIGYLVRVGSWEGGLGLERVVGREAVAIDDDPRLEFLNALGTADEKNPMRRWAEPIPPNLVDFVRPMYSGQLAVLRTVRHCPSALDLLGGAPKLLFFVALTAAERKTPWEELAEVLASRRRDVVEWCGGKGSQSAVKALEKAWEGRFSVVGFDNLRKVAERGELRDLGREWLEKRHPELLEYGFYREAVKKLGDSKFRTTEWGRDLEMHLHDVRALAAALGVEDIEARLRGLQQIGALRTLHEELVDQLIATDLTFEAEKSAKLPPPALRGNEDIVPIRTMAELDAEGRLMRHCVLVHAGHVKNRNACVYRVLRPERATLELDLTAKEPKISELRALGNAPVSQDTWRAVFAWHRGELEKWRAKKARRDSARRARGRKA
jgi:hypothetical protein